MKFYLLLAWGFMILGIARLIGLIDMSDRVSDAMLYALVAALYMQYYEEGKK